MDTASFGNIIKTLFYILIFYYVFKFLAKLFLPVIVKKVVEKASQSFEQQYTNKNRQYHSGTQQDEIIVDTPSSSKPRETKKVGEYVDYEEID
ncbi:MAG TPA: DUF4834 family protein [Flavobacterium sp.]|jgi:hypothetical protein